MAGSLAIRGALVTGASGFIGRALCAALRANAVRVTGVMRSVAEGPWQDAVALDLTRDVPSPDVMAGVDVVFHLAGKVHATSEIEDDEASYRRINVDGTRALLDAAIAAGVPRFVYASSVKAMGEGGDACLDESTPPAPETAYGRTKLEAERLVADTASRNDVHAVILRPCMVYGAGCKGNLPRLLRAISKGRFPPIREIGNKRSMVHVSDVVGAAIRCAGSPRAAGRTYIVTDGNVYSTRKIYELARRAMGRSVPSWSVPMEVISVLARGGDVIGRLRGRRFFFDSEAARKLTDSAWYSCARIARELDFHAQVDLEQGLREMVATMNEGGSESHVQAHR